MFSKIILFLFFLPIHLLAQPAITNTDITGLWKGSLYNDTTQKYLPYQIAISDEEGKLSGYSYTLFDIDGKKELGVKRIKIKRKDDQLFIEDIELISNTYSAPPPRKVRQQSVVYLVVNDTAMLLTGKWSTNGTREYLPLTGSLQLRRTVDFKPLVLFQKLVELKLDKDLSFVKGEKNEESGTAISNKITKTIVSSAAIIPPSTDTTKFKEIVTDKKHERLIENEPANIEIAGSGMTVVKSVINNPVMIDVRGTVKKSSVSIAANELAKKGSKSSAQLERARVDDNFKTKNSPVAGITKNEIVKDPASIKTKIPVDLTNKSRAKPGSIVDSVSTKIKYAVVATNDNKNENLASSVTVKKQVVKNKPATIAAPVIINKTAPLIVVKETGRTEIKAATVAVNQTDLKKEVLVITTAPAVQAAAVYVSERKVRQVQSVFFESDSLVLTLYDNGEVDGDTVSVLINGQIIFARQGLSTKANSKTIYFDKGMPDSLSMIMYAENLGSIPPNTGLLIIMDGEKRYEVRFSADLSTNAAIIFKRKTTHQ